MMTTDIRNMIRNLLINEPQSTFPWDVYPEIAEEVQDEIHREAHAEAAKIGVFVGTMS